LDVPACRQYTEVLDGCHGGLHRPRTLLKVGQPTFICELEQLVLLRMAQVGVHDECPDARLRHQHTQVRRHATRRGFTTGTCKDEHISAATSDLAGQVCPKHADTL